MRRRPAQVILQSFQNARPLAGASALTSLSCGWVCPGASRGSRGARGPGGGEPDLKRTRKPRTRPALEKMLWVSAQTLCRPTVAQHYVTMNFPRVPPSGLLGLHSGMGRKP